MDLTRSGERKTPLSVPADIVRLSDSWVCPVAWPAPSLVTRHGMRCLVDFSAGFDSWVEAFPVAWPEAYREAFRERRMRRNVDLGWWKLLWLLAAMDVWVKRSGQVK